MSLALQDYIITTIVFILLSWGGYLPFRCGQLYCGIIYCMAGAAYFCGYTTTAVGWPPWLALLCSPAVGAIFAFVPALFLKRAPGFTTAVASLALVFILQTVIMNLEFLGGKVGLFGIPQVKNLLLISVGILIVVGILLYRLDYSRLGRAAETLLFNRDVAASCGVNQDAMGIFLQAAAGALSGLAGAIFAFKVGGLFPMAFGFPFLVNVFNMLFVGGSLTIWGPAVFAPILWGIPLILPQAIAELKDVIFGGLLVVVLITRPEGVITKALVARVTESVRSLIGRSLETPIPTRL
jgi:branched-chain amino acid transport system permease protein